MNLRHTLDRLFDGVFSVRRATFITAAAAMAMAGTATAQQHSIGLKLGINGNGNQQAASPGALLPTDMAGAPGYSQTNWNVLGRWGDNTVNADGTNSYALLDSNGDDTHISIQWDATGNWSVGNGGTPADQGDPERNLMNAYDDSNNGGNVPLTNSLANGIYGQAAANKPMVYLSGLQAWLATEGATQYDVIVYMDGDATAGRTGEYWLQNASGTMTNLIFGPTSPTSGVDMTTHVFMRDPQNFTANPIYQQVPFTGNLNRMAGYGNYTVFTGLSADSFLLRTAEFNTRCGVNAIQVVPRATPVGPQIDPLSPCQTYAGGTARFRANAAGVLPFTYQWQKNGTNLVDGGNISGSTNSTLVVSAVSAADAGSYRIMVVSTNGTTTSVAAPLTVLTPTAGSYPEKIFTNNAYAYWRFNETGDPSTNFTFAYDYIGGFNATYGTTAQNGFNGIAGPQSPAFPGFENGNSAFHTLNSSPASVAFPAGYINWAVAPPLNLSNNIITIAAWINPDPVVQGAFCGLVFTRGGSDTDGLGYGNNNNLGYTWAGAGSSFNFVSGLVPASNQWQLVALVVSPTNAVLYLYNTNGQFSATNTLFTTVISSNNSVFTTNVFFTTNVVTAWNAPTYIGDDPSSTGVPQNRAFSGMIDEVSVFKGVLSDQDLYLMYKKGLNVGIINAGVATQPVPLALYAGRTATFRVTGSGDKPLTYQWRTNGVNLVNGGRISGASGPVLTITGVTAADAGSYDVIVNNVGHVPVTSSPVTLTVVPTNGITWTPYEAALQALNPFDYWRLNEATGTFAYDYWGGNVASHINGVAVAQPGPQPPGYNGLEATNSSAHYDGGNVAAVPPTDSFTDTGLFGLNNNLAQFTIAGWFNTDGQEPLRTGLFGQNDVNEFGFHGADASGAAQLGIYTPSGTALLPQSLITPGQWYFTAAVGDGQNVNLYLFGTNGGGGYLISQATSPGVTTNYGSSAFAFHIGGGGILDATGNNFIGLIDEVAVWHRAVSAGELASLFAAGIGVSGLAPQITAQTGSQIIYAGRTARYSVTVVGSSPLTYQWRNAGVPFSDAGTVSGTSTATLTLSNVASANIGSYDVVITNAFGSITSSVASLGVITPVPGSYESTVVGLNPLAYYRLNETSGTIAYDYWGGNAGVYQSSATMGVPGPQNPPFFGFESTNTAVQVAITPSSFVTAPFGSLSANTVTMAMWINPSGATLDGYAGLLANRNSGVAGGFGYTGGNIGYTWNNNNANTYNFRSGFVPPAGQWSFVGLVITPTSGTVYYGNPPNPLQSAVNTVAHTADVFGNNWRIGRDDINNANDGARNFDGGIDEVTVFLRSLTPDQMQQLYSVGQNSVTTLTITQLANHNITLTWPRGVLLEATSLTGPWTTNGTAVSPFTTSPVGAEKFYRVQVR